MLRAVVVQQRRKDGIHAGPIGDAMEEIQMEPVLCAAYRPYMVIRLRGIQDDGAIGLKESDGKRIVHVVITAVALA